MAMICVDAGTTMIKAVGYDDAGTEVIVARQLTVVTRPVPAWAEQDMDSVWDAVGACVRDVLGQLQSSSVEFLAITAQGDGVWLVDDAGEPTGPAILWNDGRAADIVGDWTTDGRIDQAFQVNGNLTSSGLPNAILAWLQRHDPERLTRSSTSLTCGGWLFARLTGELVTDESDASAPFMDIRTRQYSSELLRLYDMEWAERLLPEIRPDDRRMASLSARAASHVGLVEGTPIVLSSYDIASTALGVGAVNTGQACSILGTTLCTEVVTDQVRLGDQPAGITIAMGLAGKYVRAFPTFSGGEVIQWACRLLGIENPLGLGELAKNAPVGSSGLSFLPYLSPAGERAPFHDPLARGSFLGLSFEHDREHVARAVLEGLSLVVQDCLLACRAAVSELRVCGGGAASAVWPQIIADVTGVVVTRSTDSEVGARGAFLMGLAATGRADSVESAAARFVRLGESLTPDDSNRAQYAALFTDFIELRNASADSWPRLARMRQTSRSAETGSR